MGYESRGGVLMKNLILYLCLSFLIAQYTPSNDLLDTEQFNVFYGKYG